MTKEEKIKTEWIKVVGEEHFSEIKIDIDGWLDFDNTGDYHLYMLRYRGLTSKGYNPFKKGEDSGVQNVSIRPSTLERLEDNYGWTKIETIEDLPNGDGSYWHSDGLTIWKNPWNSDKIKGGYEHGLLTHYKPVVLIEKLPVF